MVTSETCLIHGPVHQWIKIHIRETESNLRETYCRKPTIYTHFSQIFQIFEISNFCSITPAAIADHCRREVAKIEGLGISDLCYTTDRQMYAILKMTFWQIYPVKMQVFIFDIIYNCLKNSYLQTVLFISHDNNVKLINGE